MTAGRAGQQVDDLCRACKAVRHHTVMATDAEGEIVRVVCDFCRSEHNFRSGGGVRTVPRRGEPAPAPDHRPEPERSAPPMSNEDTGSDLEALLRRVIREEAGLTPVAPAPKWRGGQLVLRPANAAPRRRPGPSRASSTRS